MSVDIDTGPKCVFIMVIEFDQHKKYLTVKIIILDGQLK